MTAIIFGLLAQPAGAQQTRLAKVPLSSLTAQGFEVKAAAGNQAGVVQTLVLQKDEQIFLCDSKDLFRSIPSRSSAGSSNSEIRRYLISVSALIANCH